LYKVGSFDVNTVKSAMCAVGLGISDAVVTEVFTLKIKTITDSSNEFYETIQKIFV
jgi:hypothetical protein